MAKMYQLIISEKPAAAEKIASALGKPKKLAKNKVPYYEITDKKIIVVPAVGHLYTLARAEGDNTRPIFNIGWKPTHEVDKSAAFSKPYLNLIKSLSKNAKDFVVATDYDIEGEVIGLNIIRYACNQKDAKRMKFSTLTAGDLREAYSNMSKTIDWHQAEAGETRHYLDFFWGINLSREASDSVLVATNRYTTLSIGRVQGPALALLAEREREIQKFVPVPYWQIFIDIMISGQVFRAIHEKEKFGKNEEAKNIFDKIKAKESKVSAINKSEQKIHPSTPFDLTTLQTEAWRCFRISPKQTLQIAQELYTAAYISYPRTSSQKLPSSINYKKILSDLLKNKKYSDVCSRLLNKPKLTPNEGEKSDPAHPAIYPTGEIPTGLNKQQQSIYDLIVKRFFSVFGEDAIRETTKINFDVAGETFILKGTRTTKQGWQELYAPYVKKEEVELPEIIKGDKYPQKSLIEKKETTPPKRYTPASVIRELEKENLGTKSTRAAIIDTLYQRGYLKDTQIKVTELGLKIIDVFSKYSPAILSKDLTRQFESDMDKIREGEIKPAKVLENAKKLITEICEEFSKYRASIGKELAEAIRISHKTNTQLMTCPKCNSGIMTIIVSKKTNKRFLACNAYPKCQNTWPLPQKGGIKIQDDKCKECNAPYMQILTKGKRPWRFCPNPICPSKQNISTN